MKIVLHSVLMLAAAGIGIGLGFAFRARTLSHSEVVSNSGVASVQQTKPLGGLNRAMRARINDDSPLVKQLKLDLANSSGVTRWLYWMEALEKAGASDFPRLLRMAEGNPAAVRFIAACWVARAPRHLLDTVLAEIKSGHQPDYELMYVLFEQWPKRDPDSAIAAMNEADISVLGSHWKFDVAYALIDKDIERGIRLMSEWHANDVGFGSGGLAAVAKWTQANPRHAAEFMLEQPDSHSIRSTIETIGREWARVDPKSAMAFATTKSTELGSMLATSALKEWAGQNLAEATDWLSAAEARTRNRLSPAFVEVWAKQDAASALTWCEENLTGSALAHSVAGVLKGADNIPTAAALVAGMEPSPSRTEAAAALAKKWFPTLASGKTAAPEAVAWLAGLDPDSVNRALTQIYWGWATSDAKSMAGFLASSGSEQVPKHAYTVVARELARKAPIEALEWATHLSEQQALTAGGAAFAEWRNSQPEAATKWLNDLPPNDPRCQSYFETFIRSLAYHAQAAEQFAAMTGPERAMARTVIEAMDLPADRRTRLLNVLK